MTNNDAFKVLGLTGTVTPDIIKAAYRKACSQYHPDRNPAGLEMMKMVNAAYESIQDFSGEVTITEAQAQYGCEIIAALNAIIILYGLDIEICGAWVWVSGDTKPHKEILKENGFKWAPQKARWYYRPESERCFKRSSSTLEMDEIRQKYGSSKPAGRYSRTLQSA